MKKRFSKIYSNRYFIFFILLFAYVQSIYIRISSNQEINALLFTPEGAISTLFKASVLFLILMFFIRKWNSINLLTASDIIKIFSISLITFLSVMKIFGWILALMFDTINRNFNQQTFIFSMISDLIDGFIFGSFFLSYYYYHINKRHQQQLVVYNQSLSESKIHQLKTQLNPHFLFNNLNVLDQLIEEDKDKASNFLNEFADIYRYVLQSSEIKIITLNEELDFAEQYFRLINHKYGASYQMKIERNNSNGFIVPLTLQLLIENAIQHNIGTEENPVFIKINVSDNISVGNNINIKPNFKPTHGRALINLKEQYKLLSKNPIEIQQFNKSFLVVIPIIYKP
jgi:sensor histidine kinase YesM